MKTVGTCSICGGPVQVSLAHCGMAPPVPKCSSCGAVKKEAYGPVIDMVKMPVPRQPLGERKDG